jgi:hypothetical protein
MSRPLPADFPPYFARYIDLVQADSPSAAMRTHAKALQDFFHAIPAHKADHRYAPEKWTIKSVLQHVIDTERIFSYRLLRISRHDTTPLASFDENSFAENAHADQRSWPELLAEFDAVRTATDMLLSSLSESSLQQKGTASNQPVTANAIAFMIFGHLLHHQRVLEERYL